MQGDKRYVCCSRCCIIFEDCIPLQLMQQINFLLVELEEPLLSSSQDAVDVVEPDLRHEHEMPVEEAKVEGTMLATGCMVRDEDVDDTLGLHRGIPLWQSREGNEGPVLERGRRRDNSHHFDGPKQALSFGLIQSVNAPSETRLLGLFLMYPKRYNADNIQNKNQCFLHYLYVYNWEVRTTVEDISAILIRQCQEDSHWIIGLEPNQGSQIYTIFYLEDEDSLEALQIIINIIIQQAVHSQFLSHLTSSKSQDTSLLQQAKLIYKIKFNMLAPEKPFPFDLGSAFANLCTYLTTSDKLSLASTCTLLRQVIMRGTIWQSFEINDYSFPKWGSFLCWVEKYLPIIQPLELAVTILQEDHEEDVEDKQLLRALLKPKEHVKSLSIRSKNQPIHLALASACPNVNRVTLHSAQITDELVEFMFQNMTQVSQLEITSDSLSFTLLGASEYLKHPLQKLILKPYSLEYRELLKIVSDQHLNRLDELEIDVEQCEEGDLVEIVSGLKHISRLRLYHMERFDRQDYAQLLADKLSPEMKELALTKCYYLDMTPIAQKVACRTLMALDLTQATKLTDESVLKIAYNCHNLRHLNLSWCNQLTDLSIGQVVKRCTALEKLTLNGLKSLTDGVFEEYGRLKPFFREKAYNEVKYEFRKECKHAKESELAAINAKYTDKASLSKLFQPCPGLQTRRDTLGNLLFLQCNSCNSVSDKILKIIYCFNRMAQVFNYYGEDLSLMRSIFEQEFID